MEERSANGDNFGYDEGVKSVVWLFRFPLAVLAGILVALLLQSAFGLKELSRWLLFILVVMGTLPLIVENIKKLWQKNFALDYIALLAIAVGLLSGQFLVAAIIVLMLSGGITLEEYGISQAKQSLTALTDRIPNMVWLWTNGSATKKVEIAAVKLGEEILVRGGEVVALDGVLMSEEGLTDESSLTGEPYMIDKTKGDLIRSGTVNVGNGIVVRVTKESADSTYRKIINMVKRAQQEKAPLIRLADRYSAIFTLITAVMAVTAFVISHDWIRVLAVLVIATPCPLILATPIALMGGVGAAAKRRIIMKRLAEIEVLFRVDTIVFDKTGTLTLGRPTIKEVTILDKAYTRSHVVSIAEAIERNSLHPLAKAFVEEAKKNGNSRIQALKVEEKIGIGIVGEVEGRKYELSKVKDAKGSVIQMMTGKKRIALFEFEDRIKEDSKKIIKRLKKLGLDLYIFTGDKKEAAEEMADRLDGLVRVRAGCTPEDKSKGIQELKEKGKIVAMVGDGINDAPALATADVGMVFSNEEQTASSEAADIVFLGGDMFSVIQVMEIAKGTIQIAKESIGFGIGLSLLGMVLAVSGYMVPITGAFVQEGIDVLVIFNALRASRLK